MSVILETKQLCKFYGAGENQVKAVNQVDIQIEQGEFVAIVGKSGSGKSTLLHMLGGLDTPTKGRVTLAGKDLYRMKEDALAVFRRRKIGFVFQAFNLVSSVHGMESTIIRSLHMNTEAAADILSKQSSVSIPVWKTLLKITLPIF